MGGLNNICVSMYNFFSFLTNGELQKSNNAQGWIQDLFFFKKKIMMCYKIYNVNHIIYWIINLSSQYKIYTYHLR